MVVSRISELELLIRSSSSFSRVTPVLLSSWSSLTASCVSAASKAAFLPIVECSRSAFWSESRATRLWRSPAAAEACARRLRSMKTSSSIFSSFWRIISGKPSALAPSNCCSRCSFSCWDLIISGVMPSAPRIVSNRRCWVSMVCGRKR